MSEQTNLQKLQASIEGIADGVKAAQQLADEHEAMFEGLDKETLNATLKATADAVQEHQDLKDALAKQEAETKALAKLVTRTGGSDNLTSEEDRKARVEVNQYVKKKVEISKESIEHLAKQMAEDEKFGHMTDHEKEMFMKDLVGSIGPQGGFFIRPQVSADMITRIFETSPMRNWANIESITSDTLEIVIDDNELTAGGWVAETGARTATGTPDIGLLKIPVHEQYAAPLITQRMLDDAGLDAEGWLSRKTTDKMSRDENTAFVVGDGNGKPRGFLTYPDWTGGTYTRGALQQIETLNSTQVVGDDFKKLQNSMIESYNNGAAFFMKRASFEGVITLKDQNDNYLLNFESMRLGDEKLLLGKPVVFFDDMPAYVQGSGAGTLPYAYGNMSMGYTIVDRIGFRVLRDDLTQKPYIMLYTTKRTGGDVTNYQSIKLLRLKA